MTTAADHAVAWARAAQALLKRGENQPNPGAASDLMLMSVLAQDVALAYRSVAAEQEEQDGHD